MRVSAIAVELDERSFLVKLSDRRELRVPVSWFRALEDALPDQRNKVRVSSSGAGLHCDELDKDLSVEELLRGPRAD